MNSEKVFLRIETPFSFRNPKTRQMASRMGLVIAAFPLLLLWLYNGTPENRELAARMTPFFVLWAVFGVVPVLLMTFNSYAMVVDGELVCNHLGFLKKRYPRETLSKAVRKGQHIEIYADTKMVVALPDSDAAKHLMEELRLPL